MKGSEYVKLGSISGVFGIQGWVKVYSFTDPREGIAKYKTWYLQQNNTWQPIQVKGGRRQGKTVIAKLEGVDYRDQAEPLVGLEIAVRREQLSKLPKGEYYWADLKGLNVETVDGVELGQVSYLIETGSNDVLVLEGDKERLVPYILNDVVKEIDLDAAKMIVDWDPDF